MLNVSPFTTRSCVRIVTVMVVTGKAKILEYLTEAAVLHDDVIKWKHFPRYWPFVRGIHRSPVNSLHKGQWRWALMFSLICAWINGWVNNRNAGDLRRHRAPYDVIVMVILIKLSSRVVPKVGKMTTPSPWDAAAVTLSDNVIGCLTYLPLDKMFAISQTIFSSAFYLMKMFEFRSNFHWSLFLGVQLIITQHSFR